MQWLLKAQLLLNALVETKCRACMSGQTFNNSIILSIPNHENFLSQFILISNYRAFHIFICAVTPLTKTFGMVTWLP